MTIRDACLKKHQKASYHTLKRIFDVLFSVSILLCCAPLFAVIAAWIRVDSPGPVFFVQQRVGLRGRAFSIFKFRTLTTDTPKYGLKPHDNDSRVTGVGRLLRQSGLDELPQFLNVLAGDMSVVGPRPEMPFIVEQYTDRQRCRLSAKPGITGPWQISPARQYPIHEHLEYDEEYIARQSIWYDVIIVVRTAIFACKKTRGCLQARCMDTQK